MDHGTASRLSMTQQGRQDGFTVYAIHRARFGADHAGEGGVQIRQRREIPTLRIGRDPSWPGDDQRYPVPALVNVGLLAAEIQVRAVAPLGNVFRSPAGAVVRCEHDDRLVGDPGLTEHVHDPADGVVDLGDEVAVVSGTAPADELGGG